MTAVPNHVIIPPMNAIDPARFTHLHVHSHYSLLGGTASVAQLAGRAARDGLKTLALTDNHALYGAVAFDRACRAAGIQPIIGMTAVLPPPDNAPALDSSDLGQIILLATGPEGYRSLCRLSSHIQGSPERQARPLLHWEELKANPAGLICLDGGQKGWLERFIRAGNLQAATHYAGRLGGIFEDKSFVGLEWQQAEDTAVLQEAIAIGARFGLRPVVAQPVYCLEPDDAPLLPLLSAIDANCAVAAIPFDPTRTVHWLSPDEIAERFAAWPDALTAVHDIISQCQPCLPDGRPLWPTLNLPAGQTVEEALREQAQAGLTARKPASASPHPSTRHTSRRTPHESPAPDYESRLAHELAAINRHGFAPLFLVVADVVRYARETAVPVSTRGSVADSLVAYALGITTVDPVANGLLFERFLNPARTSLPDIDLDFCSRRRDEVLHYVRRAYGPDRVALVATISTMQPKSAVRETAKAFGFDETGIKKLAALVPRGWHPDPRRREPIDLETILAELDDEKSKEVFRLAFRLVGQPHHLSIHPGGVIITPGPLTDTVPVQFAPKGFLTTQYDHHDVEAIGLPKLDLLGIRALTVLADAAEMIRTSRDGRFRLETIPLDDAATGDTLARGATIGVFQCESTGAQRTLRQLQARSVWDLAVANAFFKPGPATGGMAKAFVRRYRGEEQVSYLHPALEPILGPTQGVLLFQEQVLRVATEIAGLTWAQADRLRQGMSKFQAREMAALRLAFVHGCQRQPPGGPGFTPEQAATLWEQVAAFAGYGFNQGHATAYADVSYRSAYLKTHYPAEFLCARLADHGGFHHPAVYMAEARRLGIAVRPPHVNFSGRKFTLTVGEMGNERLETAQSPIAHRQSPILWLGLGQVRDVRRESVKGIVRARPFTSLADLLARVPLQTKEIRHLIQCGALDGLGDSRAGMLAQAEEILRAGSALQMAFDFARARPEPESAAQRLAWETHLLGLPISVHPLALAAGQIGRTLPIRRLAESRGQLVSIAGARLPGWTGGKGYFLDDGDDFVIVQGLEKGALPVGEVVVVDGRYRHDEWGAAWFQATSVRTVTNSLL
ncbi:MAG: DNA polymerase III subunit alpha [Chloroflexi bacterium]|nr:DNA polymerase III subunit alpha [Chloroflexota bacterium]